MKDYKLFDEKMVKRLKRFYLVFFGLSFLLILIIFLLSLMENSFGIFISKHMFLICVSTFVFSYLLSTIWTMIGKTPTKYFRLLDSSFEIVDKVETKTYDYIGLIMVEIDKRTWAPATLLSFVYNETNKVNILIHNSFIDEIKEVLVEKKINIIE